MRAKSTSPSTSRDVKILKSYRSDPLDLQVHPLWLHYPWGGSSSCSLLSFLEVQEESSEHLPGCTALISCLALGPLFPDRASGSPHTSPDCFLALPQWVLPGPHFSFHSSFSVTGHSALSSTPYPSAAGGPSEPWYIPLNAENKQCLMEFPLDFYSVWSPSSLPSQVCDLPNII